MNPAKIQGLDVSIDDPIVIRWSAEGIGFGQVTFRLIGNEIICDDEYMGREQARRDALLTRVWSEKSHGGLHHDAGS